MRTHPGNSGLCYAIRIAMVCLLVGVLVGCAERPSPEETAVMMRHLYDAYAANGETKTTPELKRMVARYVKDYGNSAPEAVRRSAEAMISLPSCGRNSASNALKVGADLEQARLDDTAAGRLDPLKPLK